MIKIGSHISFKAPKYLIGAVEESIENKANCMMIYLGAPQTTKRVDIEKYRIPEYKDAFTKYISPEDIVVHAPYITNPANPDKAKFASDFLIQEIQRMNAIGCKYLVLHPGSHTTYSIKDSLHALIDSLKYILSKTKDVVICLETMSGKGSEVGRNYDQIMYVIKNVISDRIKVCLDTCHIWDAGYDLHNYDQFKKELKESGIYEHLKVIHLNDSKNPLASHRDRHENIGLGYIGFDTLRRIVHDPDFDEIPIILETPWVDNKPIYKEEIKKLMS
ncbi:deoxyribonuclease IV [Mycoplasma sp. Ms02]|uniref:deoxyribonuclease IV n=1 Tax=Mycoplasma sp. Ms02 TaxID=353851 RepID=UPI001C89CF29|nr:deoxyribonuclease IV [Mycoplasma sp. Ms02]QZE12660.1 deoxyribonuclease IV [Mycoplasma sp. Ms02]